MLESSAYPEQEETSIEHNYSEESCASADSHEVKIQHGNQRVTTMDSEISSEKDIHEHAGGLHISSSAEIGPLEHMTSLLGKWLVSNITIHTNENITLCSYTVAAALA